MITAVWPPREEGDLGTLTAARCFPGLRVLSLYNDLHIYIVDRVRLDGLIDLHSEDSSGLYQETGRRPNYFYPVVPLMTLGED